jgi:non-heme chloroperoxidase
MQIAALTAKPIGAVALSLAASEVAIYATNQLEDRMAYVTTRDGTHLYYKDWGAGQPVLFIHGWPLSADMWEYQMMAIASKGFRAIGYDRRGFGRSHQPWTGYDYNTMADDLADIIEFLKLDNVVLVGFSMGGGEVARYIGRHGTKGIAKAVLISSVVPTFGKTEENAAGVDAAVFEGIRAGVIADRPDFLNKFNTLFYGTNRPGAKVSDGILNQTANIALQGSIKATVDCVTSFSETDFRPDLKRFDVPTLVIHSDDDQVVPIATTGALAAKMIEGAELKIYPGAPHALVFTHKDRLNADLLAFLGR